jgi:hypothetical protein
VLGQGRSRLISFADNYEKRKREERGKRSSELQKPIAGGVDDEAHTRDKFRFSSEEVIDIVSLSYGPSPSFKRKGTRFPATWHKKGYQPFLGSNGNSLAFGPGFRFCSMDLSFGLAVGSSRPPRGIEEAPMIFLLDPVSRGTRAWF